MARLEENWTDYEQFTTRDGKDHRKRVKRTTVFAIKSLNEGRWKASIDTTAVYNGKKDPERLYDRGWVDIVPVLEDESDESFSRATMCSFLPVGDWSLILATRHRKFWYYIPNL